MRTVQPGAPIREIRIAFPGSLGDPGVDDGEHEALVVSSAAGSLSMRCVAAMDSVRLRARSASPPTIRVHSDAVVSPAAALNSAAAERFTLA